MRMGNLLRAETLIQGMATKNHSVGIDHVTVVPEPAARMDADDSQAEDDDADDE